jgi:hypothetical protein
VPHSLLREQVDTRATPRTIEIFHRGKRIAAHVRRYGGQRHGTLPEHMPSAHRRYTGPTAARIERIRQARTIHGQYSAEMTELRRMVAVLRREARRAITAVR